jgi:hypothetical protein
MPCFYQGFRLTVDFNHTGFGIKGGNNGPYGHQYDGHAEPS